MPTVLALALALGASATRAAADDPKLPDTKTFDKLVVDTLRDVHNKGADLYNTSKDFSGTYRLYQGALMTVRPMLAHRPDAQKIIADALSAADKEPDAARKAFALHEAIEGVRKNLKTALGERKSDEPKKNDEPKKTDDKKPVEPPKKIDDKPKSEPPKKPENPPQKPDDKKPDDKKPAEPKKTDEKKPDAVAPMPKGLKAKADPPTASVSGTITLAGKPLVEGEVTIVSLNQPLPRVFTATIKDGRYLFKDAIPPGKYAGMVTGKGVPEKYHLISTAGLMLELAAGANTTDLVLK
jgi:hypothetical protein